MTKWERIWYLVIVIIALCVVLTFAVFGIRNNIADGEIKAACVKKCGIARVEIMDDKCFCKVPWGWQEHGKDIKIKLQQPKKRRAY